MSRRNLPIMECQQGMPSWPTDSAAGEGYRFTGIRDGLYEFTNNAGKRDLFSKRKSPPACWHLKRGSYCYDFCRSAPQ